MKDVKVERAKMVLAMEFIARQINDEGVFDGWLMNGVADGDIEYGETDVEKVDTCYLEKDSFQSLMDCFLRRMARAKENGGLFCGGVVSKEGNKDE